MKNVGYNDSEKQKNLNIELKFGGRKDGKKVIKLFY